MRTRRARRGVTTVEVVMTTALTVILILMFFPMGLLGCKKLWQVIDTLVGWPYL